MALIPAETVNSLPDQPMLTSLAYVVIATGLWEPGQLVCRLQIVDASFLTMGICAEALSTKHAPGLYTAGLDL